MHNYIIETWEEAQPSTSSSGKKLFESLIEKLELSYCLTAQQHLRHFTIKKNNAFTL